MRRSSCLGNAIAVESSQSEMQLRLTELDWMGVPQEESFSTTMVQFGWQMKTDAIVSLLSILLGQLAQVELRHRLDLQATSGTSTGFLLEAPILIHFTLEKKVEVA